MSIEKFNEKKAEIEAIPDSEIIEPNYPVAIAVQESEDVFEWAAEDIPVLTDAGLDIRLYNDIPARSGALRYAQSIWQKEYKTYEEAQKQWNLESPDAFDLRDVIVHECLHAYHNYPDLLSKVQKIAEGSGNADMLQDLSDLAILGKANPEPLTKIKFDFSQLDKAELTVETLSKVLAKANGLRMSDNKTKIIRDKAFTLLKQAVDEVRRHGQYKFWRNANRKKGYASKYFRNKNKSSKEETTIK